MSLNHQIVTLGNNTKYFVLSELVENGNTYYLIVNTDNESDIKIVLKEEKDVKIVFSDIDSTTVSELSTKFKESLEKEQKMYA